MQAASLSALLNQAGKRSSSSRRSPSKATGGDLYGKANRKGLLIIV
jgi:hypothetical protein